MVRVRVSTFVISLACWFAGGNPAAAQFSASNMQLLSHVPVNGTSFDLWGWTDSATGTEYALIGTDYGVEFFDLTTPSHPEHKGRWLTDGFDVKVYGDYAYSTKDVLDLSVLRTVTDPQEFISDATFFPSRFHNVFVNEQTGFLYGSCPSIQVYDLSDPLVPEHVGTPGGGCHDAMSVVYNGPDTRYAGREILFGSQGNSVLMIYDVEDKANMERLAIEPFANGRYSHHGWPSEDHRYFFLNDELDTNLPGTRTHIFDIQDLEEPDYLGYYAGPTTATDHNLYVKGDLLYQANYRAGVRVVQINDPATLDLEEVAYLDTFPQSDGGGYGQGAFNVYPFFESGTLIASDMQSGLFVMRLDLGNDADFNDDATIDCADIDALTAMVAGGETSANFDLTNDGLVTAEDIDAWRRMAGEALLGPGQEILPGDANLDGVVNGIDFVAWNDHKFTEVASWCSGDFNADGYVNGPDFVEWNDHKFQASDDLVTVPEVGFFPGVLLLFCAAMFRRTGKVECV